MIVGSNTCKVFDVCTVVMQMPLLQVQASIKSHPKKPLPIFGWYFTKRNSA